MASNKFATMLHRNTHRITLILVYAVLEWILIILLLLNSLFSYLIMKFASFFGLKTPCLWCSRIDHVLEPGKLVNSYRDLVCEDHAAEISKLGYCQNHRKLAEAGGMCEDCSSSRPSPIKTDRRIALFSLVKDMGMISSHGRSKMENGEKDLKCSCCGVSLECGFYSPYLLFKPSWGVLDYTQKTNLIKEKGEEVENCDGYSDPSKSECPTKYEKDDIRDRDEEAESRMLSEVSADKAVERTEEEKVDKEDDYMESFLGFRCEEIEGEDEIGSRETEEEAAEEDSELPLEVNSVLPPSDDDEILVPLCVREDSSIEMLTSCLGRFFDDDRLLPVELIDSMTVKNQTSMKYRVEEELVDTKPEFHEQVVPIVGARNVMEDVVFFFSKREDGVLVLTPDEDDSKSTKLEILSENGCSSSILGENSNVDLVEDVSGQVAISQATLTTHGDADNTEPTVKDSDETQVSGEDNEIVDTEDKPESLVERSLSHASVMDSHQVNESVLSLESLQTQQSPEDDEDTADHTCHELVADEDQGPEPPKELARDGEECSLASRPALQIEPIQRIGQGINHHFPSCYNEAEEEKAPDTPTYYIEGIHNLHKRLLFERKESGPESLDGSVISEIDGVEGLTLDRLKSALKAERRALSALYAELEEERSASAIAANQTMAMITRLQEEKAAMQMEALQYQRMMDEQSEYDQEALQLLNELMVKREKERQELEKELELHRKKVLQYEAKEKRMIKKKKDEERSIISSASSSPEDSEGLSTDLNAGDDNFYGLQESTQNTPVDEVLSVGMLQENTKQLITLDESLADFEEERLSILEQLKALEEKLFTLGDEDEYFEDVKAIKELTVYNGNMVSENYEIYGHEENGITNGFSDELSTNGKHHNERRNMGPKAKRLLPLFDAIGMENEDGLHEDHDAAVVSQNFISKFAFDDRRIAIEEEVDHVYERLQALEADREFLKHCISTLKKGDKGMDLLQEILQHLRDLRTIEHRVRNTGDALSGL